MVKPDVKHNYYADLELPPNSSLDDVKKQYRKLALLYHPDRNAGQEDIFVPKFQAIQMAHEVLGDPVIKAKYDADRSRTGGSSWGAARPKGNPYAAQAAYPRPPRRTQPGQWDRSGERPSTNPWSSYPDKNRGRPPPPPRDPAQDRTNMFKAWQNMNSARDRQQQPSASFRPPPPPRPSRADHNMPSEEEIRAGMNYRRPPTSDSAEARRTAWANAQPQRSNTTKTPRKQGFDPKQPGSDERPAPATPSAYSYVRRSTDQERPPPAAPPPGPPPQRPPRSYKPPHLSTPQPEKAKAPSTSEGEVPFAEGNRIRTPYSSFIGEKTPFQRTPSYQRPSSTSRAATEHPVNGGVPRAQSHSPTTKSSEKQSPWVDDASSTSSEQSPNDDKSEEEESSESDKPDERQSRPAQRPIKVPTPLAKRFPASGQQQPSGGNGSTTPIFSFPYQHSYDPNAKSRSEESVNTHFAPSGWSGKFQGASGHGYFRAPSSPSKRQRPFTPTGSTIRETSPIKPQFTTPANPAKRFDQKEWQDTIQNQNLFGGSVPETTAAKMDQQQPHVMDEGQAAAVEGRSTPEADKMDIDPPREPSREPPQQKQPRLYSVPPSTWRLSQQHTNGLSQPKEEEEEDTLKTSLQDLGNVHPLQPQTDSTNGLGDMSELSSTLPFESRASSQVPLTTNESNDDGARQTAEDLIRTMPLPPTAPQMLTRDLWKSHVRNFAHYISRYHLFNRHMLEYFASREQHVGNTYCAQGVEGIETWLEASGDTLGGTSSPRGFEAYAKITNQNETAREAWALAAEKHRLALENFTNLRERVKKLGERGVLK
ncbi:hypothetical protein K470DRAFT_267171 [Piedraia hortae CBS 480.64]|uniref:J domain-containing protein n=1 Tax=Piedraia hortae CBS 480.64 TaxID=1314780 RepID=A0A6A7CA75_9PEZI|nr:hypothetical protein K470DRAFT_267171 [Piedraia hortae CBS 480.64]